MRISDWSSDVCSSDLMPLSQQNRRRGLGRRCRPSSPPGCLPPVAPLTIVETNTKQIDRRRCADGMAGRSEFLSAEQAAAQQTQGCVLDLVQNCCVAALC